MKLKQWSLAGLMLAAAGCGTNTDDSTFTPGSSEDGGAGGATNGSMTTGGTTAATTGDTSVGGTTGNGNCKEYVVRSEQVTPDMLIVLDRSGSMKSNNINRWDPSVMGLKDITSQLSSAINFGLMLFPMDGPDTCGADLEVMIGPNKAVEIATALDAARPAGGTPTTAALAQAHMELGTGLSRPDATPRPKLVLLVTDGSPTSCCALLDFQCLLNTTSPVDATVEEITKLQTDGIKTYVIGYDTKDDSMLAGAMDRMAAAGGTGDTAHRAVEDSASLVAAFREIAGKAVSCTFVLEEAPPDPSYVQVRVDSTQINLDQPDGWSMGTDGKTVEVKGASCALLQGGGQHQLDVQVKCTKVPII